MAPFGFFRVGVPLDSPAAVVVFGKASKGRVGKRSFIRAARPMARQKIRQCNECVRYINETLNPQVFFERYRQLLANCHMLVSLEEYYPFAHPYPSVQLERIEAQREETINDFIDRYFAYSVRKMKELKTEKGKQGRVLEFYKSLAHYRADMFPSNIKKFTEMYSLLRHESEKERKP